MTPTPESSGLNGYELAQLSDGQGVVLNLRSGSYFKVNRSACLIISVLLEKGTSPAGISRIARELLISEAEARRLGESMMRDLSQEAPRRPPADSFVYDRVSDGTYALVEEGRTIFSVDEQRHVFSFHHAVDQLRSPLEGYVRALLPKLLSMLGLRVIHASCCATPKGNLAFTGKSGAGKTTTVWAFRSAGATVLSEDLLVLRASNNTVDFYVRAEQMARQLSARWAAQLAANPDLRIDYTSLRDVQQQPVSRLDNLWFIAADRRAGTSLELLPMTPMDGLLGLLGNGFLGSDRRDVWQRFMDTSRRLAETVALTDARMPDGLAELERAARDYTAN